MQSGLHVNGWQLWAELDQTLEPRNPLDRRASQGTIKYLEIIIGDEAVKQCLKSSFGKRAVSGSWISPADKIWQLLGRNPQETGAQTEVRRTIYQQLVDYHNLQATQLYPLLLHAVEAGMSDEPLIKRLIEGSGGLDTVQFS